MEQSQIDCRRNRQGQNLSLTPGQNPDTGKLNPALCYDVDAETASATGCSRHCWTGRLVVSDFC